MAVASQPLGARTFEEWADSVAADATWGDTCPPTTEPVTIDGVAGVLAIHCPDVNVQSAFVATQDRGYIFVGYALPDLAYFKTLLTTVRLHPEAVVTASPPAP